MSVNTDYDGSLRCNALGDARLHRYTDRAPYPDMLFVSYYDASAGVYLAWRAGDAPHIAVISQDGKRTLGEILTEARTLQDAAAEIRDLINDPRKVYGEIAGLWDAGNEAPEPSYAEALHLEHTEYCDLPLCVVCDQPDKYVALIEQGHTAAAAERILWGEAATG